MLTMTLNDIKCIIEDIIIVCWFCFFFIYSFYGAVGINVTKILNETTCRLISIN